MSTKRYMVIIAKALQQCPNGDLVNYEDFQQLQSALTTSEAENKRLREELEVCESCGNTTKIEGGNYLLWCKACWEKVVADNKRLSAIYEDWKSMEGELAGVLLKLTTATDTIKRLREENKIARCPCGGWLEGVGIDISKQENVHQCDKCGVQLITARQALKPEQEIGP